MTKVPATIGIWAIIALGLAMSACAIGGGNSTANVDDPAAASGSCAPGVCVGSTPGSTPDTLQFEGRGQ